MAVLFSVAVIAFAPQHTASAVTRAEGRALPLNHVPWAESAGHANSARRMAVAIDDDYFDGTSSVDRVRAHFRLLQSLHVKYLRCAFSWNAIEKSPGQYDWRFWDMLVQEAQNSGVQLIPYVAYTPRWAAKQVDEFWSQPPQDQARYADFMFRIVQRYRGKIHAWEIWNEPDNRDYWKGSVSEYASLVKKAAVEMRKADPSIVLVLGGMSRGPGTFFRSLLFSYKIGRYVDVIAMHAYPETWGEERVEKVFATQVPQITEMIREKGDGADLWMNEMGYADYRFAQNKASKWGIDITYDYEHTRRYQAASLFKMETMAWASREIDLTGWYRIDDFSGDAAHFSQDEVNYHLGLLDANGNPKPDYFALKFFLSLFDRPTEVLKVQISKPENSDAVLDLFRRDDGELVAVGWLRSSVESAVQGRPGVATDNRAETVSVRVPCSTVSSIQFYNERGEKISDAGTHMQSGWLTNIPLRGESIFVSTMICGKPSSTHK